MVVLRSGRAAEGHQHPAESMPPPPLVAEQPVLGAMVDADPTVAFHADRQVVLRFPCQEKECGKVFEHRYNLKVHMRKHTQETPYACTVPGCEKRFKWRSSMAHHKISHERNDLLEGNGNGAVRIFPCQAPDCGKVFMRRYNLKVHMRKHTQESPYMCTVVGCGKRFKWRSSMAHHKLSHAKAATAVDNPR